MIRFLLVLAIVLVAGLVKLPIEHALLAQDRQSHLPSAVFDPDLREQVGQLGFVAALSGFRASVADFLFIEAETAWEETAWGRLLLLLRQVTTLQPRCVLFWDMAAWHMAWNASAAALNDPNQPHAAIRIKAQRTYLALGKDFLERGIRNNPNEPRLYESLARLYQQKYNDHARASECYAKAAALPGAMSYDERFSAYELSYVEGHEREAYNRLRKLYDAGASERLPTLIKRLKVLEDGLNIPQDQRIPESSNP